MDYQGKEIIIKGGIVYHRNPDVQENLQEILDWMREDIRKLLAKELEIVADGENNDRGTIPTSREGGQ